jgi:hypothetical protein
MDKKTAVVTLLETSFWVPDAVKNEIRSKLETLTEVQVDEIGKFLVQEREIVLRDEDRIVAESEKLLQLAAQ